MLSCGSGRACISAFVSTPNGMKTSSHQTGEAEATLPVSSRGGHKVDISRCARHHHPCQSVFFKSRRHDDLGAAAYDRRRRVRPIAQLQSDAPPKTTRLIWAQRFLGIQSCLCSVVLALPFFTCCRLLPLETMVPLAAASTSVPQVYGRILDALKLGEPR